MYQLIQFLFIIMGLINHDNEWCFHPLARYFRDYKEISPWKNEPLDKYPTKYRQMRLYAKFYIKNGNFIKAMYWIIRSILKKYKK